MPASAMLRLHQLRQGRLQPHSPAFPMLTQCPFAQSPVIQNPPMTVTHNYFFDVRSRSRRRPLRFRFFFRRSLTPCRTIGQLRRPATLHKLLAATAGARRHLRPCAAKVQRWLSFASRVKLRVISHHRLHPDGNSSVFSFLRHVWLFLIFLAGTLTPAS